MNKPIIFFSVFLLLQVSCKEIGLKENRRYNNIENLYENGYLFQDSIFHGIVKKYDTEGIYKGYSNYRFGLLDGASVEVNDKGITTDSVFFKNGSRNGFSFEFNSDGNVLKKVNFFSDRPVGESFFYDSVGNLEEYRFRNFEGEEIYTSLYKNENHVTGSGNFPVFYYDTVLIQRKELRLHIFLYLIKIPDLKVKYYIGTVNDGTIITKTEIKEDSFFYEGYWEILQDNSDYALFVEVYNKVKNKHDLYVHVLN